MSCLIWDSPSQTGVWDVIQVKWDDICVIVEVGPGHAPEVKIEQGTGSGKKKQIKVILRVNGEKYEQMKDKSEIKLSVSDMQMITEALTRVNINVIG